MIYDDKKIRYLYDIRNYFNEYSNFYPVSPDHIDGYNTVQYVPNECMTLREKTEFILRELGEEPEP